MHLLITIINNEEILDELITGWLDIGITGSTLIETTDSLQIISQHIPIFAGFRAITSGGMRHNKTLLTVIEDRKTMEQAIAYLESLCRETGKTHQGIYLVLPITSFGRLGYEVNSAEHQKHMEKKIGRPLKAKVKKE